MRQAATKTQPAPTKAATTTWVPWLILGTVCTLVIGFFGWSDRPGWLGIRTSRAEDAYYNLMVRGFRAGQLDLKAETTDRAGNIFSVSLICFKAVTPCSSPNYAHG